MSFVKRLEVIFVLAVFLALGYLVFNWYQVNHFKNNPLPESVQKAIIQRQNEVLSLIREKYAIEAQIPLVISDKFSSRLYGLTRYEEGKISIYLNKKRFQESSKYMIDEVIPHEYAHALVFLLKANDSKDGHSDLWQKICLELDGKGCMRYVDNEEIIAQKMNFQNGL